MVPIIAALQHPKFRWERSRLALFSDCQKGSVTCTIWPSNSARRRTWCRSKKPTLQRSIPSVTQNAAIAVSSRPSSSVAEEDEEQMLVQGWLLLLLLGAYWRCQFTYWLFTQLWGATMCRVWQWHHKWCVLHKSGHFHSHGGQQWPMDGSASLFWLERRIAKEWFNRL